MRHPAPVHPNAGGRALRGSYWSSGGGHGPLWVARQFGLPAAAPRGAPDTIRSRLPRNHRLEPVLMGPDCTLHRVALSLPAGRSAVD